MTRYCTPSHTFLPLFYEERLQILSDVSNESLNIHNVFINSQCTDGYPESWGRYVVKY